VEVKIHQTCNHDDDDDGDGDGDDDDDDDDVREVCGYSII
jgi:hypothetical protein